MKACPNAAVLQLFKGLGLKFDTSSGYECTRAIMAGVPAADISLSSQEFAHNMKELIEQGISINLCSID